MDFWGQGIREKAASPFIEEQQQNDQRIKYESLDMHQNNWGYTRHRARFAGLYKYTSQISFLGGYEWICFIHQLEILLMNDFVSPLVGALRPLLGVPQHGIGFRDAFEAHLADHQRTTL